MCYVCCLCYKIPMRCHWCCCFRYTRNSSLFFSFGSFGLNLYIILYILRSLWVQEHANVVSLCLFLNVGFLCVRLFLCAFHVLSPFAFANCRGKSFTVLWVVGLLGGGFLQWTRLPDLPSEWFALWRGWQRDIWWVIDDCEWLTYSAIPLLLTPFLVPQCAVYPCEVCVNQMSVWAKIQIPLSPYLSPPYSQPLRVDVAVLSTSSRGQDPTFSS